MAWKLSSTDSTVTTLRINASRSKKWEQWILLTGDVHFDNPMCNRKLYKRHLEQALERNAPNIDVGDFNCIMQSRTDPRHEKGHLRKENNVQDYFGSIIRSSCDFLKPYSKILAVRGIGNHESKILKHSEIDVTRAIVDRLKDNGSPAILGDYRGWVRIMLKSSTVGQSFNLYYTHGSGGSAIVTKGVIRTNRRASYIDADIIIGGHIHEAWSLEMCRAALTDQGKEVVKDQLHLCVPTYKDEFLGKGGGFHQEKEGPPKPLGAWWLRFFYDKTNERFSYDYMRAK